MILQGTKIKNTKVFATDWVTEGLVLNLDAKSGFKDNSWRDYRDDIKFNLYNLPTKHENYVSFDANSFQYGDVANSLGDLGQWTIEAWFRPTQDLTSYGNTGLTSIITTVFDEYGYPATGQINFCFTNYNGIASATNAMRVGFYNGHWHVTSGITLTTGNWYHIAGSYDSYSLKQYNNGIFDESAVNVGTASSANGGAIRIARRWDGDLENQYCFPGDIGIVRIYNRVLSDEEISNNFNKTRNRFGI